MAKFRRGHSKHSGQKGTRSLRFILLVGVLLSMLFFLFTYLPGINKGPSSRSEEKFQPKYQDPATEVRHYLPSTRFGNMYHHRYYSISYSEEHEQSEWVAYELTREMLNAQKVARTDWFEQDASIPTRSAHYEDYRSSGFTKGHLAPAADMAFSKEAMDDSFLMSNISPQDKAFNQGIWRELEESTRDWARKHGHIYVVTGPVLTNLFSKKIGRNRVSVPSAYYKVMLAEVNGEPTTVGFIIPNAKSERPLHEYMVTVDQVESITGIDFYQDFLTDHSEENIESRFDTQNWPFDTSRYQKRINQWNQ